LERPVCHPTTEKSKNGMIVVKPRLRILHTADLHLGAKFVKLGAKGSEQRKRLRQVLSDIVDLALREQVDIVLLAGDTFDNQHPSPESISAFQSAIERLQDANIPVIIIAGTHDFLSGHGVLTRYVKKSSDTLVLLHPQRPTWKSDSKQVVVHGISLEAADAPKRPVAALQRNSEPYWQIGMAHASLEIGRESSQEAVFSQEEVSTTELDYLALGHWHRKRDCSSGSTVCWYSGSPEMIAFDEEEQGCVLLIDFIDGKRPSVRAVPVGKRSLVRLKVEINDPEAVIQQVRAYANPDCVLDLTLTGIIAAAAMPDLKELQKRLQDDFFFVRIHNTAISEVSAADLEKYPDQTVVGRFIRLVQEQKQKADPAQCADLDQALQLGMALLSGREVLP